MNRAGFCIYVDTVCAGPVPLWRDELGNPVVYQSLADVQREMAKEAIERFQQFLDGERDFEDAATIEEYVVEVDVLPDGSIIDADGNCFGAGNW